MRDGGGWPPLVDALLSAAALIGLAALALDLMRDIALGILLVLYAAGAA